MATTTFAFTAAQEPPPLFAETLPVEFGSAGTTDVITFPAEAPVTATLPEPSAAGIAALGGLLFLARGRRRGLR
jgi:hypothetical protein